MPPRTTTDLTALMFDSWMLANEAAMVMWLRSARLMAGGPGAEHEATRMVQEKLDAGLSLWPALMQGGFSQSPEALGRRAVAHYSGPVRANRRRLSRK